MQKTITQINETHKENFGWLIIIQL